MLPPTHTNSQVPLEEPHTDPEDVAERRRRGEVSCAECRRLKIRCDKNVPCKSCVRRGCRNLCPNGRHVTADGPKQVLAATNHLHGAISDLRNRVRDLESSLNHLHITRVGTTHPLLNCKNEDEDDTIDDPSHSLVSQRLESKVSTLAIAGDSSLKYFGAPSGAFIQSTQLSKADFPDMSSVVLTIDPELFRAYRQIPFPLLRPLDNPERRLRVYLPDPTIRDQLLHIFHNEVGDPAMPAFTREYLQHTVIPRALHGEGVLSLAALGSLFSLLAVGALFRIPGPGEAPQVDHYARISAVALGAIGTLSKPYIEIIEATYARGYLELMRQGPWDENGRTSFALACHRCLIAGLHRDPAVWDIFTPEEIQRRRMVFWMMYTTDAAESLSVGRPANLPAGLEFIDTESGDNPLFRATRQYALLMSEIATATLAKRPSYIDILRLDERVRALYKMLPENSTPAAIPPPASLFVHLHRTFFAHALADHPKDPLLSEYAPSVHAVLRGAREHMYWLRDVLQVNAPSVARLHYVWAASLACSLVYVLILGLAPECALAEEAEVQLKLAIECFEIGARFGSGRAKHSLAVITVRSTGTTNALIPRVVNPSPSLEPEEKFAWDPTSLVSPLYNPLDGGHQDSMPLKPPPKRASLSPPADERSKSSASYPKYTNRHQRRSGKDIAVRNATGTTSTKALEMNRIRSSVPEILIYESASLDLPSQSTASSQPRRAAERSIPPSVPSLTSEWNALIRYDNGLS